MYEDAILIFIDVASAHERAWDHVCLLDVHLRHIVIDDVGLVTVHPLVDSLRPSCLPVRNCDVDVLHTCLSKTLDQVLSEVVKRVRDVRVLSTPTLVSVRTL
jgi:hypothetical protein